MGKGEEVMGRRRGRGEVEREAGAPGQAVILSWLLCGQWDDPERGVTPASLLPFPMRTAAPTSLSPRLGAITDTVPHLSWIQRYPEMRVA